MAKVNINKKRKAPYLIEFRLRGFAKRYSQELIKEICRKFHVRGMKSKVSHITLYGPFSTNNEKRVVSEIYNLCKAYERIYFSLKGFEYFNNPKNKVIFLDVFPSEQLKQYRYELSSKLRQITSSKSNEDKKNKAQFKFHSTLAYKDIDNKFNAIWNYLSKKSVPHIRQTLLRTTILKNGKILYEYDFLLNRFLNRRQALSKRIFKETIRKLKQKSYPKHISQNMMPNPKKQTIWEKIKSFFNNS